MKIVLVNKFYYRRAGAEAYLLDLEAALTAAGHEVAVFATAHPENLPSAWSDYFPRYRNFAVSEGPLTDAAKVVAMIWSREAAAAMRRLVRDFKPDVVHLQNIYHHLSPSIIAPARASGAGIVLTLHDYKWICPNYTLFTDGERCERCHVYRYWNAVRFRCLQGSRAASAAAALEMYAHRAFRMYERQVDRFIAPSAAMRDIFIRWGKDGSRIEHLPNLMDLSKLPDRAPEAGEGMLFVGRLEEWKGVRLLPELAAAAPDIRFRVVGDGPLKRTLMDEISRLGIRNLELLGFQPRERVYAEMQRARAVLVPSIGYDPFPTTALEAGALGKPVIGSALGGIPEIVRDRETGVLVPPGDVGAILDEVRKIQYDPAFAVRAGAAAARHVRNLVDPGRHVRRLLQIYEAARDPG